MISNLLRNIKKDSYDSTTNANKTIDYSHYEIHAGSHFKAGYQDTTMDTDAVIELLFITPDSAKWAHWTLTAQTTGAGTVQVFRGPTVTANGTAVTPLNRSENSLRTSDVSVYHTPTTTADGTKISERWIGSEGFRSNIGGEIRGSSEIILKQNTIYLVRATANADGIKMAIGGDWYEHTNKS